MTTLKRGNLVLPGVSYLDLAVTHDFPIFKVAGTTVWAFTKVMIQNFMNHQQIIGWNTTSEDAQTAINEPWVYNSAYGTSKSSSNYGTPRTIQVSAGFRF
jgi:hypothetical protein